MTAPCCKKLSTEFKPVPDTQALNQIQAVREQLLVRMPACIQFQAPVCGALLRISFNPCSFCFGFKLGSKAATQNQLYIEINLFRNEPIMGLESESIFQASRQTLA